MRARSLLWLVLFCLLGFPVLWKVTSVERGTSDWVWLYFFGYIGIGSALLWLFVTKSNWVVAAAALIPALAAFTVAPTPFFIVNMMFSAVASVVGIGAAEVISLLVSKVQPRISE